MKSCLLISTLFAFSVSAQTTIFQANFSTPSSYYAAGGTNGDWIVTTSPPQGPSSQLMGAINSTSGGEFALFDSEFVASSAASQNASIVMSESIDGLGYVYFYVCFESYYRHDSGVCAVKVSTDQGATWTMFPVHDAMNQGDITSNPELVLVEVTAAVIADPTNILIGFYYDGLPGYAWMVDDICVQASNSPILGNAQYSLDRDVLVYPNPSNGAFSIQFSELVSSVEIELTDAQGRSIDQFTVEGESSLNYVLLGEPGVYFIHIHDALGNKKVVSFVKT